jgi:AcrR family transcriptional regulator
MATAPTNVEHIDGRSARRARTRERLIDALLALLEEGDLRPTTERIAARAGVSERSVFQHFSDREDMFAAVGQRQFELVIAPIVSEPLPTEGTLDERLDAFTARRARLLEAISPVRRSAVTTEPFSPAVHDGLTRFRDAKREAVAKVFAPELARAPADARAEIEAAIGSAASWSAWEGLRVHQGLSVERARAVLRRTLEALLRPT